MRAAKVEQAGKHLAVGTWTENKNLPKQLINELQDRWTTPKGAKVLRAILADLRSRKNSWRGQLADLDAVSVPAPYPEVLEDLRGLKLERTDLQGVDLSYVNLSYASLKNCNFNRIKLQGSVLNWADLGGTHLIKADLLQIVAFNAIFDRCKLIGCMMMASELNDSSFKKAKLMASIMDGSDFTNCDLEDADFQGVHYIEAQFPAGFDLERTKLNGKTPDNDAYTPTPK